MIAMARFLARASLSSSTLVSSMSSSWNHSGVADYRSWHKRASTLTECLRRWFPTKCSTCMVLSSLAEVVFSEEVSSSRQNISSWVCSAEKMTWKHPNKVAQYKILKTCLSSKRPRCSQFSSPQQLNVCRRPTSFCSNSGRASVSRVIQKLLGAILAVMSERRSLAASLKRFSPYSLWNSRYFPTKIWE